jgi:hypothetical protein
MDMVSIARMDRNQVDALPESARRIRCDRLGGDGLTREQVAALTPKQRRARRDRLFADQTPWYIPNVAIAAGVSRHAVTSWRNNQLNGFTGPGAKYKVFLPSENPEAKQQGDARERRGTPWWKAGRVRWWLWDTERLDEDLFHFPGGRRRPGVAYEDAA